MFEPPVRVRSGGGYASVSKRGKRFYAQVGDVTVSADTLAELQRKVSRLQAEQAEDAVEPARKALPAPKVTKVADPVAEPPAPVPAEQVDAMVAQFIAQQQALVDQYQREVEQLKLASLANTAALRASMQQEVEQRVAQASADMDAVVALMMDEPVPMSVAAPQIQVMLPKALPAKKDAREKRVEKQSRVAEMGAQISKTLGDLVASALTERTKEVEPLQNEIKRLNEELSRVTEQSSAKRRVVRENGKVTGVMVGDEFRPVERDEAGRIVGI